ncbi:unnamed protein product, partial [Owenia fusiformis]
RIMRLLILNVLILIEICKSQETGGNSIECKCESSDECSITEGPGYGCQSDDEVQCDCSTCTCSRGSEEYLYQSSIEENLPFTDTEIADLKAVIGDKKDAILDEIVPDILTLLQSFGEFMNIIYEWVMGLPGTCTDINDIYINVQELINGTKAMLKRLEDFRNSKTNWEEVHLQKLNDKLHELRKMEFQLDLVQRKIEAEMEKFECVTDGDCPSNADLPERIHCKSDCMCHECRNNTDCKHPKPKCNENSDDIMVCGDPHIKQTIRGTDRRFCYDIYGAPDSTYLYLHDDDFDVRSTLISVVANDGELAKYVGSIRITKGRVVIRIDPYYVRVDDNGKVTRQQWKYGELKFDNGHEMVVFDSDTTLKVVLGDGKFIDVWRHDNFMSFDITELSGLSNSATGIMGSIGVNAVFKPNDGDNETGTLDWQGSSIPLIKAKYCWKIEQKFEDQFTKLLDTFKVDKSVNDAFHAVADEQHRS